jgi:hypothetical protein
MSASASGPVGALFVAAALSITSAAGAKETVVDDFEGAASPSPWVFYNGAEFPGATGALSAGSGRSGKGAHLAYDFTGGGHYVSMALTMPTPIAGGAVSYWVKAPGGIHATLRVRDSTDQTLQYDVRRPLEAMDPSVWYREVVELDAPSSHYGGANDGVVHPPIVALTLLAADPVDASAPGAIDFDDVAIIDAVASSLDPAAPLIAPPPGSSDLASRLAVNIHFTKDDAALDIARDAGFSTVRMDLGWGGVERTQGAYDFGALDGLVASLAARSMRLHLILDYFNPLYPGADAADYETTTVPAFAAMSGAAAAHFAGKNVTFEIWNEPNLAGFWPPTPDATRYAALSAAAIAAIHTADASAKVSTAGISGFDFAFLRGYLAANGGAGADAIGVHPYRQIAPETLTDELLWMRTTVANALSPAPPIWDTEWGYSSTWYGDGHDAATRQIQAVRTVRKMLSAWAVGFPLSVYYDLRDDGTDGANGEHNFGLVQNDYSDKPAIKAVRTLSKMARDHTFAGFISLEPSSVHAMRLDGATDTVVVVWSDAPGGSVDISAPPPSQLTASSGVPRLIPASHVFRINEQDGPVFFQYPRQQSVDAGTGGSGPSADAGSSDGGASSSGGAASSSGGASSGGATTGGGTANANGGRSAGAAPNGNGGTSTDGGLAAGSLAADDSGCGCRMARRRETWASWSTVVIAALLFGARRRTRSRADSETGG